MRKSDAIVAIILISIPLVLIEYFVYSYFNKPLVQVAQEDIATQVKNITYSIDIRNFKLTNGRAELTYGPDSATRDTLTIFGEPVIGDLNGDGQKDAAILLANETGGSGTFYYAALALKEGESFKSTNLILIGDRIAPQTVEIHEGRAVYNYAVRKQGEDFSVPPSLGESLRIKYLPQIGRIVADTDK